LWAGEIPLARTFWEYTIVYGFLANLLTTIGFFAAVAADAASTLALMVFLLPVPYNALILVAVWRSAGRYPGPRHWIDLARTFTALWVVVLTVS
jgi:hypothetical protein